MRNLLLLFFIFFQQIGLTQFTGSNLLPVKVDQKWGLINENGTLVVEPKYDLFGEKFGSPGITGNGFSASFYSVQLNDKVGLINLNGQEVLPPIFDEIIDTFSDSVFTVMKDGVLLVVNGRGETIFDGEYESVIPIPRNKDYFIVKEDGLYGLKKKGEGYVIPNEHLLLTTSKVNMPFLNFYSDTSTVEGPKLGLISFENKIILPAEFNHIQVISKNHFIGKKEFLQLFDAEGNNIIDEEKQWNRVSLISKNFISFLSESKNTGKIFSLKSNSYLQTTNEYDAFFKFGNNFLLARKKGVYGLIDTLGTEVIKPQFKEIAALESDTLFRVKKIKWGVFHLKKGIISELKYDNISLFQNAFAQAAIGKKLGLLNRKGEEVAPPLFESFQFQDEFVKAFQGTQMNFYEADAEDRLTLLDVYPEVYTVRIGYGNPLDDVPNVNPNGVRTNRNFNRRTSSRRVKKKPDYSKILQSDVEWFLDWGLWGLRRKSNNEVLIKPKYEHTRKLPFTDLTIVYSYDDKIEENEVLKYLTIDPKKGTFGMAFYSHEQEKFISDFEYMGIRVSDFEYDLPYASCLDKNGKFVLISKTGKVFSKKKTFDYIGEFFEGKAQICIGATPNVFKGNEDVGYKIGNTSGFQNKFQVRYNRFLTAPSRDFWWIGGTWGFIDTLGNVVIPPTYEFVKDFKFGTAICKKENWGAIDGENKTVLDFKFKSITRKVDLLIAGVRNKRPVFYNATGNAVVDWGYEKFKDFSEGFCAVKKNGKWGMVNAKGEEVLPCEYLTVNSFSDGLAGLEDESGWSFVDSTMEIQLDFRETEYLKMGNFSEGLCWFKIKRNEKFLYGFLNREGETVINSVFTRAFDFEHGVARVVSKRKTGLIDKTGEFVMFPKYYDLVFPFEKNGIAQVRANNMGPYGLINSRGETLTKCIYNKIFPFNGGYAKVVTAKGIGFVDTLGQEIISPKYRAVGELSEGLVAVQNGFSYLWEYINMDNKIAFPGKYSIAEPYQNGKAIVTIRQRDKSTNLVIDKNGEEIQLGNKGMVLHFSEDKYGFRKFNLDPAGEIVSSYCFFTDSLGIPLFDKRKFHVVEPFENDIALVQYQKPRKWGTINRRGFQVIPKKFNRIFKLPNQMYSAIASELVGLYDEEGKQILETVYDNIEMVKSDIFKVEQGSKIGYFTTDGIWIWQLQD